MKHNPAISIITLTLNSITSIEKTLLSVANQSFTNIEHLIIDGQSTDGTLEIVKRYQLKYNHIKIISEPDAGIYDAMNKAINLSIGEWVYFLGSDDIFYDDKILETIFTNDAIKEYHVIYGNIFSNRFGVTYDEEFTYDKLAHKNICHQAIFFRRDVFAIIGNFNLKYTSHADWDHNIRWFFNQKIKNKYVDLIIANYADGGYSSVHDDLIFRDDRTTLLIKQGYSKLSLSNLAFFLRLKGDQQKNNGDLFCYFFYKSIARALKLFSLLFNRIRA
jgi:glycosyltransferase involved in cell wall biosynthesis